MVFPAALLARRLLRLFLLLFELELLIRPFSRLAVSAVSADLPLVSTEAAFVSREEVQSNVGIFKGIWLITVVVLI